MKEGKEPDYQAMTAKPLLGLFPHSDHIKERLEFIKQVTVFSFSTLSRAQLARLWKILITNNEILVGDHKFFYIWLSQLSREVS